MNIPALLYGQQRDVKARTRTMVTALQSNTPILEAIGVGEMVDTDKSPGLIVLDGPSPLLDGEDHFHCYLPLFEARAAITRGRLPAGIEATIVSDLLAEPWGLLVLASASAFGWLEPAERHRPFLLAMRERIPELDGLGARYTTGSRSPKTLWQTPNMLHHVLAMEGIPGDELRAPQSVEGIVALMDRVV